MNLSRLHGTYLVRLPADIRVHSLKYFLPARTLLLFPQLTQEYTDLVTDPEIWKFYLQRDYFLPSLTSITRPRFFYVLFERGLKISTLKSFSILPCPLYKFICTLDELAIESIIDNSVKGKYNFRITYFFPSSGLRMILEYHPDDELDATISFYRVNCKRVTYTIIKFASYTYLSDEISDLYKIFTSDQPITKSSFSTIKKNIIGMYNNPIRIAFNSEVCQPRFFYTATGFDMRAMFAFEITVRY